MIVWFITDPDGWGSFKERVRSLGITSVTLSPVTRSVCRAGVMSGPSFSDIYKFWTATNGRNSSSHRVGSISGGSNWEEKAFPRRSRRSTRERSGDSSRHTSAINGTCHDKLSCVIDNVKLSDGINLRLTIEK